MGKPFQKGFTSPLMVGRSLKGTLTLDESVAVKKVGVKVDVPFNHVSAGEASCNRWCRSNEEFKKESWSKEGGRPEEGKGSTLANPRPSSPPSLRKSTTSASKLV